MKIHTDAALATSTRMGYPPGWDQAQADRALALSRELLALPESERDARRDSEREATCNAESTRGDIARVYRLNPGESPRLWLLTLEPEPVPAPRNTALFLFRLDYPGLAVVVNADAIAEELAELEEGGGVIYVPGSRLVEICGDAEEGGTP